MIVTSLILIRGGVKGLGFVDSFTDIFARLPVDTRFEEISPIGPNPTATGGKPAKRMPESVERWRGLVAKHFPPNAVDDALKVMYCESAGNPQAKNPVSGASGLFQHLPKYWQERSYRAGVGGADIMNPEANVIVAAWLYRTSGNNWTHWECKP